MIQTSTGYAFESIHLPVFHQSSVTEAMGRCMKEDPRVGDQVPACTLIQTSGIGSRSGYVYSAQEPG